MLNKWTSGDKSVEQKLIKELYPMIHVIAQKQINGNHFNNAMETTDVVQEAFIKLQNQNAIHWKNRNQFFAISAKIIRRLLIDELRANKSKKRGELQKNLTIDRISSIIVGEIDINFDLLEFDKLLKKLNDMDKVAAKVVELRFFTGLTQKETAEVCEMSIAMVNSNWNFARSWLLNQLTQQSK
ncbi:MAG: sigma-70 family RNA polymerase sigma factor [Alcanivoracaceae bacterium]|nr:sigma-70 family RNA polymerase sigma factor [Alcanivoracaceae bacterium]